MSTDAQTTYINFGAVHLFFRTPTTRNGLPVATGEESSGVVGDIMTDSWLAARPILLSVHQV